MFSNETRSVVLVLLEDSQGSATPGSVPEIEILNILEKVNILPHIFKMPWFAFCIFNLDIKRTKFWIL